MTRKDYEYVAQVIARIQQGLNTPEVEQASLAFATRMAAYFAADNPRFDRDRFMKACNPHRKN